MVCNAIVGRGGGGGGARGGRGGGRGGAPAGGRPATSFNPREIAELRSKLRGASYIVTHRKDARPAKIDDITIKSVADLSFALGDSRSKSGDGPPPKQTTVLEYFKGLNLPVQFPQMPAIQTGGVRGGKGGSRPTWTPLEFCEILPNHPVPPTRLSGEQTSEIIAKAATKPQIRRQKIDTCASLRLAISTDISGRSELNYDGQELLKSWGLQISKEMEVVPARVLAPPDLLLAALQVARHRPGA